MAEMAIATATLCLAVLLRLERVASESAFGSPADLEPRIRTADLFSFGQPHMYICNVFAYVCYVYVLYILIHMYVYMYCSTTNRCESPHMIATSVFIKYAGSPSGNRISGPTRLAYMKSLRVLRWKDLNRRSPSCCAPVVDDLPHIPRPLDYGILLDIG